MFRRPLSDIDEEWYYKYGKIHGYYDFQKPILTVGDPQILKQIMIKDFHVFTNRRNLNNSGSLPGKFLLFLRGESWKRVRSIISPTFSSAKIKKMYTSIDGCVKNVIDKLTELSDGQKTVDAKWLYGSYTMDIIAKCAFATDTDSLNDPKNPFVVNASRVINIPLFRLLCYMFVPSFILNYISFTLAPPDSYGFFYDVAKHVINERKKKKDPNQIDFLQLLIDAEKPDESNINDFADLTREEIIANTKALKMETKEYKKLEENEIIANIILFFVAGYETTGSLLAFCTYNLALNPECQEILYEEIKNASEITYDSVNKFQYLDAVISETLRLHNPVTRIDRDAVEDYYIPELGITLKRDDTVNIPIHAIHHDPEFFPNPYTFDPQRFMGSNRDNIKPYTFFPFGMGPRNCIGMRFALIEAKLALSKILLNFRFFKINETQIPLEYLNTRPGFLQAKSIVIGVEKRK